MSRFIHRFDDRYFMAIPCAAKGECQFPVWRRPAAGASWQWNGNEAKPTITPSINCFGGCGRHFTITDGQASDDISLACATESQP